MPDDGARRGLGAFGPNAWLVEEMYDEYRRDPSSVSENWREFFADYEPGTSTAVPEAARATAAEASSGGPGGAGAPAAPPVATAPPAGAASRPGAAGGSGAVAAAPAVPTSAPRASAAAVAPLRGAAATLAANMEESLEVPTATSVRAVPAKLLEVNRGIINDHLARTSGAKVSFTHLIGYAVVRAAMAVPAMRRTYVPDVDGNGRPGVAVHEHVGLGVAVDLPRRDGTRSLVVPCVKEADRLDFRGFVLAYEDLLRRARAGKLGLEDFTGVTLSLTNPGTIGTEHSVPRLMPGQAAIVGVGAIGYPAEYEAADPTRLAEIGVGKVVTLTSTYDHRVIQGAESGLFLAKVHELLLGADRFYDEAFASMGVPYEPVRWRRDTHPVDRERAQLLKQVHVQTLINMYRVRGHLIANLDPLELAPPRTHPELDPATYGLTLWDLDREFLVDGLAGKDALTLGELLGILRDAYCRTVGVEYMHIQEPEQKRWIQEHVEGVPTRLSPDEQRHILGRLNAAEAFERFLHSRYVGQKRFGLEGAESAIPLLDAILDEAAKAGLAEAVIGMAHRGRLNVLANIVGKSYAEIFREFEGDLDPESVQGSGDVKYHKGASGKFVGLSGADIPVTLASNPSHLEAVDPVVEGMARARQDLLRARDRFPVLPLLVHGDAAFAGQGVVAETLNLSALRGYRTGGTIHLVINNQLGFTTAPEEARSSVYPTDIAKMVQAPIFHVNGDDPEACVRVARLAFAFRERFHKDVVIDMVCYRRHGHNEADEPSYTQPLMYAAIERKRSVRKLYTETLVRRGDLTMEEAEAALEDFSRRLQAALEETRSSSPPKPDRLPPPAPPAKPAPPVRTGVARDVLDRIAAALHTVPEGFTPHPKLARQLEARAEAYQGGEVDWSLAEAMAFGSLLLEGTDVRLAGQDTRRGTFSQRHAALVDYRTGEERVPLAELAEAAAGEVEGGTGRFFVYDSLLSEYAALGFEYGYSVVHKDALVCWEAQFGDFVNGAQIILDQFVVAAEDKWGQTSGLVLLLPHGYEGQGPEHSSARPERFLTLAAEGNITVAQPTTAAQYFHLLRAQVRRPGPRRPLVVLTPKSLLRARVARSRVDELERGSFEVVLDDPAALGTEAAGADGRAQRGRLDRGAVRRVILCSGKVAYEAMARRDELLSRSDAAGSAAVVRLEQLYPWPADEVAEVLARYPSAEEVLWLQEEPENMGAWAFVHGRLHRLLRERYRLGHASRAESPSPATGSAAIHRLETEDLLARAFAPLGADLVVP
jgi:2-oxoglutarate decarboxylase